MTIGVAESRTTCVDLAGVRYNGNMVIRHAASAETLAVDMEVPTPGKSAISD